MMCKAKRVKRGTCGDSNKNTHPWHEIAAKAMMNLYALCSFNALVT